MRPQITAVQMRERDGTGEGAERVHVEVSPRLVEPVVEVSTSGFVGPPREQADALHRASRGAFTLRIEAAKFVVHPIPV